MTTAVASTQANKSLNSRWKALTPLIDKARGVLSESWDRSGGDAVDEITQRTSESGVVTIDDVIAVATALSEVANSTFLRSVSESAIPTRDPERWPGTVERRFSEETGDPRMYFWATKAPGLIPWAKALNACAGAAQELGQPADQSDVSKVAKLQSAAGSLVWHAQRRDQQVPRHLLFPVEAAAGALALCVETLHLTQPQPGLEVEF